MAYRIMIVIEDLEYLPDEREGHLADAGWYGWVGRAGDFTPQIVVDYEEAMAIAEELTVCGPTLQRVFEVRPTQSTRPINPVGKSMERFSFSAATAMVCCWKVANTNAQTERT